MVHRLARMDDVIIRRVDSRGRLTGFDRFVGLFTSKAYAEEAQHIPILRAKLKQVIEAEGAIPGSHDYKELISLFNSFPKEELFRASVEELRAQLAAIIDSQASEDIRVNLQFDANRGMAIVLLVMPRERVFSEARGRIQDGVAGRLWGDWIY